MSEMKNGQQANQKPERKKDKLLENNIGPASLKTL